MVNAGSPLNQDVINSLFTGTTEPMEEVFDEGGNLIGMRPRNKVTRTENNYSADNIASIETTKLDNDAAAERARIAAAASVAAANARGANTGAPTIKLQLGSNGGIIGSDVSGKDMAQVTNTAQALGQQGITRGNASVQQPPPAARAVTAARANRNFDSLNSALGTQFNSIEHAIYEDMNGQYVVDKETQQILHTQPANR